MTRSWLITAILALGLAGGIAGAQEKAPESPLSGRWEALNVMGGSPWVFDMTVSGWALTGRVFQRGGEYGPAAIYDGKVDGNSATFKARNPTAAKLIEFKVTVARGQAQFTRSVEILLNGAVDNAQTGQGAKYGVFGELAPTQFIASRVGPAPVPPIPPAAAGAPVNVTGRWESLQFQLDVWKFDLRAEGGALSGTANFATGPGRPGTPRDNPIREATIDGSRIAFKVVPSDNSRTLVFTGTVQGDEIAFTRRVEVPPGGQFGFDQFYGAYTPSEFVARRVVPPVPDSPLLKQIAEARAKWAARQPSAYEFSVAWECVCPFPREAVTYRVSGPTPTMLPNPNIVGLDSKRVLIERQGTMEHLFGLLEGYASRQAHSLKVIFDPKLGYPLSANIDFGGTNAYDDLSFTVTGVRLLQ